MKALGSLSTVCVAIVVLVAGCSAPAVAPRPVASARNDSRFTALEAQNAGLQDLLLNTAAHDEVDPEPRGDALDGLYMAEISAISSGAAGPVMTVDFMDDGSAPGTDSHGWNRFKHAQRVGISERPDGREANVVLQGPDGLEVVPVGQLVSRFGHLEASGEYYVELTEGRADRVWPVAFP